MDALLSAAGLSQFRGSAAPIQAAQVKIAAHANKELHKSSNQRGPFSLWVTMSNCSFDCDMCEPALGILRLAGLNASCFLLFQPRLKGLCDNNLQPHTVTQTHTHIVRNRQKNVLTNASF